MFWTVSDCVGLAFAALGVACCVCAIFDKRALAAVCAIGAVHAAGLLACGVCDSACADLVSQAFVLLGMLVAILMGVWAVSAGALPKGVCVVAPLTVLASMGLVVSAAHGAASLAATVFVLMYFVIVAFCFLALNRCDAWRRFGPWNVVYLVSNDLSNVLTPSLYGATIWCLCLSDTYEMLLPLTLVPFACFASVGALALHGRPSETDWAWAFTICAVHMAALGCAQEYALCVLCALVLGVAGFFACHTRGQRVAVVLVVAAAVCAFALHVSGWRLDDWIFALDDPVGDGYAYVCTLETAAQAKFFGYGDLAGALRIPDAGGVFSAAVVLTVFGWSGLAVAVLAVASVAVVTLRSFHDYSYWLDHAFACALLALLVACAAGNLLYVFHIVPLYGVCFPLMSADAGSLMLFGAAGAYLAGFVSTNEARARVAEADGAAARAGVESAPNPAGDSPLAD